MTLRYLIDWLAIFAGYCAAFVLTRSICWGFAGAVLVASYGLWCFYDGGRR